ncbi:jg21677 [Pararge aegeria aegeria]|uniref:Jg21677 protein n=1 Tax=Pararge aegeria aegeria TaxID=348720 RepID=A0A8S4RA38_9NEOP|nr:jg21677 [Pararge aegeria aegeria]
MRRTLEARKDGIVIGGQRISNLRFADDTTLFATSIRYTEDFLQKMEYVSLKFSLKINRSKTKVTIVDRMNSNLREVSKLENCEVVQSYVYLGATMKVT